MSEIMYGYVGGIKITPNVDPDTRRITRLTVDVQNVGETAPGSEFYQFVTDDGGLAGLLAAVLAPDTPSHHRDDLRATMNGVATARDLARDLTPHLATVARDRSAWSWRQIAASFGIAHRTVERQVSATRREMAESGVWIDAHGIHDGTTPASRSLSRTERVTIARALAHHRETTGARWEAPVEITVPDRLVPGQVTTATAHHRRHPHHPATRMIITAPVTLKGGPAHGQVADIPTGATTHTTPGGDHYRPTTADTWTHEENHSE